MSRSSYYPRKRARILARVAREAAKNDGKAESTGSLACAFCHVDLPVIRVAEFLFVQTPLGFLCKAPSQDVCPLRGYLATGTATERSAALPLDSAESAFHSSPVGQQGVEGDSLRP